MRIRTCVIPANVLYFSQEVYIMPDYQKMYYVLCAAASKAIDTPPEEAKQILQKALYEAEEIYIRTSDDEETRETSTA